MASPYNQSYAYQAHQAYRSPAQPFASRDDELHLDAHHDAHFSTPGTDTSPPPPPIHRVPVAMNPDAQTQGHRPFGSQNYSDFSPPQTSPHITPGADNLSEQAAGGGINGIAAGVANANERESGVQAMRDVENWGHTGAGAAGAPTGPRITPPGTSTTTPFADQYGYEHPAAPRPIHTQPGYGNGANAPLAAGSFAPASVVTSSNSERSLPLDNRSSPPESIAMYQDNPYNRYSSSNLNLAPQQLGAINPLDTDDDDDWGMGPSLPRKSTQSKRRSFVPVFGTSRDASRDGSQETIEPPASGAPLAAGVAAGAGATAGATAYAAHDASGNYNAVPGGSGGSPGMTDLRTEKAQWLAEDRKTRKRTTWIVCTIIVLVCIGAIVGGIAGTQIHKGGGESEKQKEKAAAVAEDNKNELGINSAEIKKLMGNKDLHKVFPGMDYTPLNAQYPDCMHVKPSQNNITRDIAVMSQLTNQVRLYGTDCNQTEMVLEAIDRLELPDMKVWLGVWLGNNDTTNTRQVKQMHDILDNYDADRFMGVIVGNEVLYREDLTREELLDVVAEVRSDLKKKGSNMKVAISDLGDNWTSDMAKEVDVVMSNVHPFFAGVKAEEAAAWTMNFWETHDVVLTADDPSIKHLIAEVGWPTKGGNNCGGSVCADDTSGSVASIKNLNTFLEDWVCPSLKNGTDYFWFSMYDEPWKIQFNEKGKEWEDQWGLMDVNRNLKPGVTIPDCGEYNIK